jgi:hypothetical protein
MIEGLTMTKMTLTPEFRAKLSDLRSIWKAKHPSSADLADSVAALRAAHAEMSAGDVGRPARQALRESCQRLGLVIEE